jgi:hypothetical protein
MMVNLRVAAEVAAGRDLWPTRWALRAVRRESGSSMAGRPV